MAELTNQKHYLDHAGLVALIKNIKAADAADKLALEKVIGVKNAAGTDVALKLGETTYTNMKAYVDAAIDSVNGDASALTNRVKANEDAIALLNDDAETAGSVAAAVKAEADRIDAIVGTPAEGKTIQGEIEDITKEGGAIDVAVKAEQERAEGKEGELQDAIDAEEAARKAQIGDLGKVGKGEDAADHTVKSFVEAKIAEVNGDAEALEARVEANEDAIALLNGADTVKGSVKNTVAAELANIVNENNNGSIDTLNEIAAWIVNDTTGAAKMANDIAKLNGIDTVEGSVANSIKVMKEALDATVGSQTVAEGKHVAVEVVEEDGKLTGLTVTEADIASAAALSKLQAVVGYSELAAEGQDAKTVKARLETLEGLAGTESVEDQIEAAIDALGGEAESEDGTFVNVKVTTENGEVTAVSVTENDIASATLLGKKDDAKTAETAFGYIAKEADRAATEEGAIRTLIGTVPESVGETATENVVDYVDAKVAAANAVVTALNATESGKDTLEQVTVTVTQTGGKITGVDVTCALEPCTEADINALFAEVSPEA